MEPPILAPGPLHHARFIQPRLPAFWLYTSLVVLTGIVAVGEQNLFREMSPGGWALSWGLVAVYAAPVAVVVYVLDLYEREPIPLLVAAFVWGGVAATTLSAIGNAGWALVVARAGGPEFATRWSAGGEAVAFFDPGVWDTWRRRGLPGRVIAADNYTVAVSRL